MVFLYDNGLAAAVLFKKRNRERVIMLRTFMLCPVAVMELIRQTAKLVHKKGKWSGVLLVPEKHTIAQ